MSAVTPSAEQFAALSELPQDVPIVMINLLAFKRPDGVRSYERYALAMQPHLERAGARVLYDGEQQQMVVGEGARTWWDAILLVEYPSTQAFIAMASDPDVLGVHEHREAALERAELIATVRGMQPARGRSDG